MNSYTQVINKPIEAYFFNITYIVNGRKKSKKGTLHCESADAAILLLLDQYPSCKGQVGRVLK